jgi:multidrug efflux pump subunit AcrA (membrane-fusion protein)
MATGSVSQPPARRFGLRGAVLAVVAVVALVACGAALFGDRSQVAGGVPTFTLEAAPFERLIPAEGNLRAEDSTVISLPPSLRRPMRIAWLAEDGSRVAAGDPVVRFDPTEMEKELLDAEADRTTNDLRVEQEQASRDGELANLDRDAELAKLELDNAKQFQKQDELIFSRHEIIESEIDGALAEKRMQHATDSRRTRESLSDAEMELLAIDRRKAQIAIDRAREGLDALVLSAPHDGIVIFRRDWRGDLPRVGETVWGGNPLAEIPDLSAMEAEVYVLEADAGGLAAGVPAEVRLEAHPRRVFAATVSQVDKLAKPRRRGSPVQYFAVVLDLDETVPEVMKPGQRVRATLRMDALDSALTVPRQAVFDRDGEPLVYRRSRSGFEPVTVELGPAAMGRVVVAGGLDAGDVIALADPQRPPEARFAGAGEEGEGPLAGAPGAAQ